MDERRLVLPKQRRDHEPEDRHDRLCLRDVQPRGVRLQGGREGGLQVRPRMRMREPLRMRRMRLLQLLSLHLRYW